MARPVLHLPEPEAIWFAASAEEAAAFDSVDEALAAIVEPADGEDRNASIGPEFASCGPDMRRQAGAGGGVGAA